MDDDYFFFSRHSFFLFGMLLLALLFGFGGAFYLIPPTHIPSFTRTRTRPGIQHGLDMEAFTHLIGGGMGCFCVASSKVPSLGGRGSSACAW